MFLQCRRILLKTMAAFRCRRLKYGKLFIPVFILFYFLVTLPFRTSTFIQYFEKVGTPRKSDKLILVWTPYFKNWTFLDDYKQRLSNCDVPCTFTVDKSDVEKADVVYFHLTDMWKNFWEVDTHEIIPIPSYRRPDQIWLLHNMEPTVLLFGDLRPLNGLFNWTMWYRHDSDIWSPYEHYEKRQKLVMVMPTEDHLLKKTKNAAGLISNCWEDTGRYVLVGNLLKMMDLDMYGKCYGDSPRLPEDQKNEILSQYKFYFALENSKCTDYISEKYFGALRREQIPVVNWYKWHPDGAIPGSYININDFYSLSSFVGYLKRVASDDMLYNSYFDWKKTYKLESEEPVIYTDSPPGDFCQLCKKLHKGNYRHQVYSDLAGWVGDDTCPKVTGRSRWYRHARKQIFDSWGV